jgi:hypothetical protein
MKTTSTVDSYSPKWSECHLLLFYNVRLNTRLCICHILMANLYGPFTLISVNIFTTEDTNTNLSDLSPTPPWPVPNLLKDTSFRSISFSSCRACFRRSETEVPCNNPYVYFPILSSNETECYYSVLHYRNQQYASLPTFTLTTDDFNQLSFIIFS